MLRNFYRSRGAILADEMGLGKTAQVVALVNHAVRFENRQGPYMVVAPLSTLDHWKREFERWTDLSVCLYWDAEGGRTSRDMIRDYEWYYPSLQNLGIRFNEKALKFQVRITSHETLTTGVDDSPPRHHTTTPTHQHTTTPTHHDTTTPTHQHTPSHHHTTTPRTRSSSRRTRPLPLMWTRLSPACSGRC